VAVIVVQLVVKTVRVWMVMVMDGDNGDDDCSRAGILYIWNTVGARYCTGTSNSYVIKLNFTRCCSYLVKSVE